MMKIILSLTTLIASISLLFYHSTSFTTARIETEGDLSVVSEENALVAVDYIEGKKFTITNNTAKTIHISKIFINEASDLAIKVGKGGSAMSPGEQQEFNIPGDPKEIAGKEIRIEAYWNGGNAEIQSTIPGPKDESK